MAGALVKSALLFSLIIGLFFFGVNSAGQRANSENLGATVKAVKKAAVQCYSIEGIYPPNLAYLKEHYGVQVDEDRYFVLFDSYGANIMPEIQVFEKG